MPRPCTVCRHPKLAAIEKAMADGQAATDVSRNFSVESRVSDDAIRSHMALHAPRAIARRPETREARRGESLAEEVRRKKQEAEDLQARATSEGDYRAAMAAIKVWSDLVELLIKAAAIVASEKDEIEVVLQVAGE